MATKVLSDLTAGAKELADMSTTGVSGFVTAAQWRLWVNEGVAELHQLVSTSFEDTFFTIKNFTMAAAALGIYTLPTDFMRMRGLDIETGTNLYREIHRFNWAERNMIGKRHFSRFHQSLRYRIVSRTTMYMFPVVEAIGTFRMYYAKRYTELTTDATALQDELQPWWEYPMIVAAIKAVAKQDGDTSDLRERRDIMRADIANAGTNTDENESDTIVDVESEHDGWGTATVAGGGAE